MDRAFVSEGGPREKPIEGFQPLTINTHICHPAAEVEVCDWCLVFCFHSGFSSAYRDFIPMFAGVPSFSGVSSLSPVPLAFCGVSTGLPESEDMPRSSLTSTPTCRTQAAILFGIPQHPIATHRFRGSGWARGPQKLSLGLPGPPRLPKDKNTNPKDGRPTISQMTNRTVEFLHASSGSGSRMGRGGDDVTLHQL